MAVLASVAEPRLVYLRMTGDALRADAGRFHVSVVVAGLALRLGVTPCETQARMVLPDVGDFGPVGLAVAGDAFRSIKRAVVGILVARHALGLQSEKRSVAAPIPNVVAVLTLNRTVSALERPTRLTVIKPVRRAAGPTNELRSPSEVLDVTVTTLLPAILAPMQPGLFIYLRTQVVMTREASISVEPSSGRVTLATVRVAIDVRVVARELSGRQKLSARRARHQRSGNRSYYHQAAHDQQRCDASSHSEKIQRYP